MKKLLTLCLCVLLLAGMIACAQQPAEPAVAEALAPASTETPESTETPSFTEAPAPVEPVYARMVTEIPADADLDTIIRLEKRNFKNVSSAKLVLDTDSYTAYSKAVADMKKYKTMEAAEAALAARDAIIQNDDAAERIWYLWDGSTIPMLDGENFSEEEVDKAQMLGSGFEPFIITYLLDDPASAKGHIVAVSGGGMIMWSNDVEGVPAANAFNELGYNYFLLQRRLRPYSNEDIFMDFQRAVRLVRYHAEKDGYGHADMIAGLGWSGGGATVMGAVNYLYGNVLPTVYDTDYIPDEIDAISSDMDVAMPIYGGGLDPNCSNPRLPAFYIAHGTADETVDPQSSIDLYDAVKDLVPAELYLIEGAGHAFGAGVEPATGLAPGAELWPGQADAFMQANYGHSVN